MKKILLLSAAAALGAAGANALEPQVFENVTINMLSPDGNMGVSSMYGTVTIFDFANNKTYEYGSDEGVVFSDGFGDDTSSITYNVGNGNCISSTGIVVGGLGDDVAAYWENGEWKMLPTGDVTGVYSAHGVSADGSVICGIVPSRTTGETTTLPAVWTRKADGTYNDYVILPHPEKDFTGRDPQYITAVAISADGKTVAGQVLDYRGGMPQPIIYRLNDKNEWVYELVHSELLNVSNLEFPEWENEPYCPKAVDFMSPENKEAYDEAFQNFVDNGYDPNLNPDPKDYMTAEQVAEFDAAAAIYNQWVDLCTEVNNLLTQLQDAGALMFEYNNVALSCNGKYLGATATSYEPSEDGGWPIEITIPCIFNLETGEYKLYPSDLNIGISFVSDNGDALAGTVTDRFSVAPTMAYVLKAGEDSFGPLVDFLSYSKPTVDWMKENMSHDGVIVGVGEDYEYILEDNYMVTGLPIANADMSVIATWTSSDFWDIDNLEKPLAYSYLLVPGTMNPAGVTVPAVGETLEISVVDGTIVVNGEAASVEVYDLNGRVVMSVANPGATVETSLASGLYIVKAVAANGETVTVKAAL